MSQYRFSPPSVLAIALLVATILAIVYVLTTENQAVVESAARTYQAYVSTNPSGPKVIDVTIPRSTFAYHDAIIATALIIAGIAMLFATLEMGQPVMFFTSGTVLTVMSIGVMVSRSSIVVAFNVSETGMHFIYEPNPMMRIYIAPMVLGILLLTTGMITYIRNSFRIKRFRRRAYVVGS